jgi:hypothetical protein
MLYLSNKCSEGMKASERKTTQTSSVFSVGDSAHESMEVLQEVPPSALLLLFLPVSESCP